MQLPPSGTRGPRLAGTSDPQASTEPAGTQASSPQPESTGEVVELFPGSDAASPKEGDPSTDIGSAPDSRRYVFAADAHGSSHATWRRPRRSYESASSTREKFSRTGLVPPRAGEIYIQELTEGADQARITFSRSFGDWFDPVEWQEFLRHYKTSDDRKIRAEDFPACRLTGSTGKFAWSTR